jgi:hypothetical protein
LKERVSHIPEYISGTGASSEVLPDGSEWDFVCENAKEKESANGNPMIELELRILGPHGEKKGLVYDHLVFSEKSFWKIDAYRQAVGENLIPGQQVIYNADDAIDGRGRLVLMIDSYQGRNRNKVAYYITDHVRPTKTATTPAASAASKNEFGEPLDVPF